MAASKSLKNVFLITMEINLLTEALKIQYIVGCMTTIIKTKFNSEFLLFQLSFSSKCQRNLKPTLKTFDHCMLSFLKS